MADEPKVTLSSKPFDAPGNGHIPPHMAEYVTIHVSNDATEGDVRRALHQYPAAIEGVVQAFREMRAQHPNES